MARKFLAWPIPDKNEQSQNLERKTLKASLKVKKSKLTWKKF